jgi:hypothetical protein
MAEFPKALMWQRVGAAGAEQTLLNDASGLHARGIQLAGAPVPYSCRYELYTDDQWATVRFEAAVDGPGFLRTVRMERAAGRWRVTASEQGDLDVALQAAGHPRAGLPGIEEPDRLADAQDIDLALSPLTNTLPIRRLGLLSAKVGTSHELGIAFVVLPSLEVVHSRQTYIVAGEGQVAYRSGTFEADIAIDGEGYVTHYPGLATRA